MTRGRGGLMIAVTVAVEWPLGSPCVGVASTGSEGGLELVSGLQGPTGERDLRQLPRLRRSSHACKCSEQGRSLCDELQKGLCGGSSWAFSSHSRIFLRNHRHKSTPEGSRRWAGGRASERAHNRSIEERIAQGRCWKLVKVERSIGRARPTCAGDQCDEAKRLQDRQQRRTARIAKGWRGRGKGSERL
jgi:hypothetical protein